MFVLIHPKSNDSRKNTYPLGLAYIAASFEKHGRVRIFDLHYEDNESELMKYIVNNDISFVGLTIFSDMQSIYEGVRIARLVKECNTDTIVGIGGSHATFQGENILRYHIEFDAAFIAEGEIAANQMGYNFANNK